MRNPGLSAFSTADRKRILWYCQRGVVPLPSSTMRRALGLAGDELCHDDELVAVLDSDPRLQLGLLYGIDRAGSGQVKSVHGAVARMGRRKVLSCLWLIAMSDFLRTWPCLDEQVRDRLWRHSLLTGILAEQLLNAAGLDPSGEAVAAGLAHDIGHLLVTSRSPPLGIVHGEAQESQGDNPVSSDPDRDHCRLGAALLQLWNAPDEFIATALDHHDPTLAPPSQRGVVVAVRLADLIAEHLDLDRGGPPLQLTNSPTWQQIATIGLWNQIPHLDRIAIAQLPDAILQARHVAQVLDPHGTNQ